MLMKQSSTFLRYLLYVGAFMHNAKWLVKLIPGTSQEMKHKYDFFSLCYVTLGDKGKF